MSWQCHTFPTDHRDRSPLNLESQNIYDIFVTQDTFQLEMSPLNFELWNMPVIFFAFLTFHSDMFPSKSFNVEMENRYEKFVMQETSMSFKLQKKPYSSMWFSIQPTSSSFVFGWCLCGRSSTSLVFETGLMSSFSFIYRSASSILID